MTEDWVIDAFGARWSLDTRALPRPERDRLHVLWGRCRVPGAAAGDEGVLPFPVSTSDPYAVSRAVTLASLRRRRGSALLLHAVGLSERERAVALVGASGAGKSTAAMVLGRHFGYLSDETVAVEADGRVTPYPKPVSVVTDPATPWEKHELSPDELGLREVTGTAHLHGLVVLERDPAHEAPELVELPLVDALLATIAQSSSLPLLERPLHRLAGLASASGGPYVLRYREIGDCVELVRGLLDGTTERQRGRPRAPWTSTPGTPCTSPVPNSPIPPLRTDTPVPNSPIPPLRTDTPVMRAPWVDAVHGEGGTLVLVGDTQVRLGPVGEVVWRLADRRVTVSEATAAVVRALGAHPEADRLVAEGVDAMIGSGVLQPG
ncbi:hypothetical protein [Knoellia aerolata]|uniref:Uncharacterized protein n=1 Tax=Knoellia aerolata DSM 18566 TaxID=1385519 RepID=A0A0A0JY13_9MICO|nr:hypothetical protein [Knoellia aerolata]KGN40952.1 hypothetical protein N801_10195 [Knoellia aerolata DSM 18566]